MRQVQGWLSDWESQAARAAGAMAADAAAPEYRMSPENAFLDVRPSPLLAGWGFAWTCAAWLHSNITL
jgi:hypothetical protein